MTRSNSSTLVAGTGVDGGMPEDLALIFAYHFPPDTAIGGARPFRFYKYLSRLGYRCHVISAADVDRRPELDAEFVDDPFVSNPRSGLGWQIERGIRKLLLPGVTGSQWSLHAYRAAARFLKENKQYRVTIFSTYPPLGVHLAAYWLARKTGFPWIVDFRDPLADNPGHMEINRFTDSLYRRLESIFVHAADCVIANTDAAETRLKVLYPERANHIRLIWNGFDPEERLQRLAIPTRDRRVIAHVGELYGRRDVSPVLQSLRRLIVSGKVSDRQFQVYLAGQINASSMPDPAFTSAGERDGWLKLTRAHIPQSEAHQVIQTADGLFLIQPQTVLQVPGKLFEYLQIGRPILAYVPPNSPVERILARSGVPYECAFAGSSPEELDAALLRYLNLLGNEGTPNDWFENEFNAEAHARKVAHMIGTLGGRELESAKMPVRA